MKRKDYFNTKSNSGILFILAIIAVAVITFTACGKNSNDNKSQSEIAPPPPPPPPPDAAKDSDSEPFTEVDEMPLFPGSDTALLNYIARNTTYPAAAKLNNIQGRVLIRFCITAEGKVTRVSVQQGVDRDLDNEALRVVKTLPDFKPGKKDGVAVPVWYTVPISFRLN